MAIKGIHVALLVVVFVSTIQTSYQQYPLLSTLVRRNVPPGTTFYTFVETCEACGEMFGSNVAYKCLTDKKGFATYLNCMKAISK